MVTLVLGASFGYHDSAVAVVNDREILFAQHEERVSRTKFDSRFPRGALRQARDFGLAPQDVDAIILHEKPVIKLERQVFQILGGGVGHYRAFPSHMASMRKHFDWGRHVVRRNFSRSLGADLSGVPILYSEHHLSHAAAAFYTSPFDEALVIVLDAVGEWDSTTVWRGSGNSLTKVWAQGFPHSIGLFYSAMTQYLGFKVNTGEYKLMGLAPYGDPVYVDVLSQVVTQRSDGAIELDLNYFDFVAGSRMVSPNLERLLAREVRSPSDPIDQWHADVAASVQQILEMLVDGLLAVVQERYGKELPLCLGGGVALNCVMNGKLADEVGRDRLFVFPAAGDSGGAVGAALAYLSGNHEQARPTSRWGFNSSLLGPQFSSDTVRDAISAHGAKGSRLDDVTLPTTVASLLAEGKVVGVFSGRSEFGPRALGNRSILADPRIEKGQIYINERIKFRESFRPFAPIALQEEAGQWFTPDSPEPYMIRINQVRGASVTALRPCHPSGSPSEVINISQRLDEMASPLPSVTHLDGSARLQTIPQGDTRLTRGIMEEFFRLTGCPVLINTSFNVRGEPIVDSPTDALRCLATTGLDAVVIEDWVLMRHEQSDEYFATFSSAVSDD